MQNENNTSKTNKGITLDLYQAAVEARYPGKGTVAREIVLSGWDDLADQFVWQSRLDSMGYKLDTQLAMNCIRGIVERNPALNVRLRSLKD